MTSSRVPHAIQDGKLDIYVTENDQKLLFVKDAITGENHRTCLTPPHDSVSGATGGIGLSVGVPGVPALKEGMTVERGKGELSLGGRSPAALISRELMYRACELSLNLNADKDTTLRIYERFLQALEKVAAAQTEQGDSPLSMAEAPPAIDINGGDNGGTGSDSAERDTDEDDNGDVDPTPPDPKTDGAVDTSGLGD
ncbi:MAG TPA: hypothetical protein DD417_08585 [Elusimicrobia bacterium]|nr:hypothetical protein [Elusimicrobiota bacterium]